MIDTHYAIKKESDSWQLIIKNNDHEDLWAKIDWKDNIHQRNPHNIHLLKNFNHILVIYTIVVITKSLEIYQVCIRISQYLY